jgi:hypothetical protein
MQILRAGQPMELQVKARDMNEIRKVCMLLLLVHSTLLQQVIAALYNFAAIFQ